MTYQHITIKHTPGPWHIGVRTYYAGRDVYGPHGQAVAVAELKLLMHPSEAEANARLIAAAPELAVLVRKTRDYLSGIPETAAGGDDEAVALTRKLTALLTRIDGAA
jgi:hypothetical protein